MFDDPEIRFARNGWLRGGSALPVVRILAARGDKIEAATIARLALAKPDCPDAAALRELLSSLSSPPEGWGEALVEFARSPSAAGWLELLRFVPGENLFLRVRDAIGRLRTLGVDGDTIFRCASESGMTPDLIELVEEGEVSVKTLVERAARAGGAKTVYLGLAAVAAFLAGDFIGTVRLLREARAHENDLVTALPQIMFIRERATPEQIEMLNRAGIPGL
jgi:hypothetical protein